MAISIVESTADGSSTSATSVSITMPTTKSGRLLVVIACGDGGVPSSVSWPAGWDEVVDDTEGDGTDNGVYIGERILDGTEGSSISVTFGSSVPAAWAWYRMTDTSATEATEHNTGVFGFGDAPNPGSLSPSHGSQEYMWVAPCGTDLNSISIDGTPTGFGSDEGWDWIDNGFSAANAVLITAELDTASSKDPSAWSLDFTEYSGVFTLAVPPSSVGGVSALASYRAINRGIMRGAMRGAT